MPNVLERIDSQHLVFKRKLGGYTKVSQRGTQKPIRTIKKPYDANEVGCLLQNG